jgi:peptidoglycan/LPS O-acetylase OafA/YrhL
MGLKEWLAVNQREADGERSTPKGGFRPDVEGLRAVAVGVVLLYHAGLSFAPGGYVGVDVFFVISGFLITGLLVKELEGTGTISLSRFYSRRAKRLLPLTVVVLAAVVALSWAIFDPVRMDEVSFDVVAAGLYFMNWWLAFQAADYFGAGLAASPVQHFWTLAVEEQFYLVWPAFLLAVAWWCRRWGNGISLRPALAVAFLIVAVASFGYGVYATDREAGAAYFSTFTRGWELALGGALALVPTDRLASLPRRTAGVLAWAGLVAIVFATVKLNDDTLFPGIAALMPTLGTAAIIAAGFLSMGALPQRLLSLGPVRHVGRISYSWYLWHWPPLVFAAALWGSLSPLEGIAVLAVSYVPAVLTNQLVEKPFLHARVFTEFPRRALVLGGACTAASVALGVALFLVTPGFDRPPESQVAGAEALRTEGTSGIQKSADAVNPTPREASDLRGRMYEDGCHVQPADTEFPDCVYGDPEAETTVALFGDSHAMHWFPALDGIAKERDWRLVGITKSACPPADVTRYDRTLRREYRECDEWRQKAIERIVDERPSMIVTGSLTTYGVVAGDARLDRENSEAALEAGYISTLERLRGTGAKIAVMKDVPHPDKDIPECVSRSLDRLENCAFPRDKAFDYPKVDERVADRVDGASLIDPTPVLCPGEKCPAVIGDALVYRNGTHLTPTYVRTLVPWLDEQLPEPADS